MLVLSPPHSAGERLSGLKQRLQQAMALRRQEERVRKAALHRLDNEECGEGDEEEEEEEEEMTDDSEAEVSVEWDPFHKLRFDVPLL